MFGSFYNCRRPDPASLAPLGYMVEPFQMFLLTDFAMQSRINLPRDLFHFKPNFLDHLDAVNTELRATGRPEILTSSSHSS